MKSLSTLSAFTLSLALASPAAAFNVKETSAGAQVHWRRHQLPVVVLQTGDVQKDELLLRAVQGAAAAWARSSNLVVDIRVAPRGTTDIGFKSDATNESVVKWSEGDWSFDPGTLALTFLRYDVRSGEIYDADILVNDTNFNWTDKMAEGAEQQRYDLQNTITHELGHALGLAHSHIDQATMFPATDPGDVEKRELHYDDISGAQIIYGEPTTRVDLSAPLNPPTTGCSTNGGPTDPALIGLFMFGFVGLLARRRRALVRAAPLVVLAMMFALPAQAGERARTTVQTLLTQADAVVRGKVVHQRIEARDGVLVTISTVRVDSCVAGQCPRTLELEQLGGEKDGIGFAVEGITLVKTGDEMIVAARNLGVRWAMVGHDAGHLADLATLAPAQIEAVQLRLATAFTTGR